MIVQLQCHCHWSSEKQNRIANLIAERAELILGNSVAPLVRDLIFVDKLQPSFQSTLSLIQPNLKDICLDKRSDSTYRLVLSSETLLSLMTPGAGQARFDERITSAKNAICESQLYNRT